MSNVIKFSAPETYFSREHGIAPGRHESVTSIRLGSPPDDASEEQRFWYQGEVVGYIRKRLYNSFRLQGGMTHAGLEKCVYCYEVNAPDYGIDCVVFEARDYYTGARGALAAAKAYARDTLNRAV